MFIDSLYTYVHVDLTVYIYKIRIVSRIATVALVVLRTYGTEKLFCEPMSVSFLKAHVLINESMCLYTVHMYI